MEIDMHGPTLQGWTILLVEDEPMIAMDIEQAFGASGASMTTTTTLGHALLLIDAGLSAAIVDHAWGDGDCSALCTRLTERGVPFIVYSGNRHRKGPCSGAPHIDKPAAAGVLVAAVVNLVRRAEMAN